MILSGITRRARLLPDVAIESALRVGGAIQPLARGSSAGLPPDLHERVLVRWPRDYGWPPASKWGDQLVDMLRRRIRVEMVDRPQTARGTIEAQFVIDGRAEDVAFNLSDYPDGIDDASVSRNLVTFKFQFRERGYADSRIVPGGYLPSSPILYSMLRYLRWTKDHARPRFDVYGRFSLEFAAETRQTFVDHLERSSDVRFHGGTSRVRYSRYLREIARSRICLDLPGQGPLCFRLIEYLAVGACIVAMPHGVRFPPGAEAIGSFAMFASTPETMVSECREALRSPERLRGQVAASRELFDRVLHRDQLSAYYLRTILAARGR